MPVPFRELLASGRLILFDGGLGTMLYSKGIFLNTSFDLVNLQNPGLVQEVHELYLAAGSEVIETNTFGANPYKLKAHGLVDQVHAINLAGARIARKAAGELAYVAGSIGPLGVRIEPLGPTSFAEAQEAFEAQVLPLLEGGVDLFVVETFTNLDELTQAVAAIRKHSDLPILASVTVDDDGNTIYGTPPERFTPRLDALDVDILGLNCSVGPKPMLEAIQNMSQWTDKPLAAQPNAGHPRIFQDRTIYLCSPEYMASYARKLIKAGVQVLGGCCGTTPEHIREIARSVKALQPMRALMQQEQKRTVAPDLDIVPVPLAEKSRLAAAIASGRFVVSVELTPPKGCEPSAILEKARELYAHGVDAINLPDGPRASARMSNQILSILMHQQIGIEPIPHYCCRDRNLLGMQSDLLGLYSAGIHNILLITGDPPKLGDYPDATAVFDVDAIGLTNIVKGLNHGYDLGQNPIGKPTGYFIGVGVNPCAVDLEREIRRYFYKVEAGAEYAITQPVFDVEALLEFLSKTASHRIPVLAGIWPLASYRNAEFMNNEVPGVVIPEVIMQRMYEAEERGEGREEGVRIAQEMVRFLRPHIQGIQISAPFGRLEPVFEVMKAIEN
ncbi:bifunctional homocysteine S-methyltransferase/methylenetetrahydrofolate reductase [bacterium (Candidatus Blackallbacteria) CG17_big_fil_post_rev_8_21_14_2_50_48_46]|uniref:Bifunctional homocysteine S-methyltransferase/methylenetetrahydrofolate reductase n=1 Tax=bacterium (Candidatus Blackallbacteria) CG17_big_fil_post_rev_8_21_14_2_50_48_46 TaxID=2014261 RepID=A0A2M7GBV7_9BACT|nr:MAG: bifunctional homocysteine S-methyltransferase/methylenetetrahydrofolate reductase [bacterium (Candidatus Blackallbacteria) CG18_big_fil_WC_8_21_14_2_50_49_26]PIW19423.1 MAG: bifunctional homocysteine S-methyltransferase/methylenetetrahydrofolate reductase [bacterium (Candidatus Blackallbacteria) CG17_big_fil_post_rev_8_21_14_2_50_48_46]PIW48973.1 MAG: bifunctional homocysteine S-methyltransferase/methylenetetrahydrofolate reductase [bacterium (Candidatus Blackallbacteria) CG13_big_fil_rev